MKKSTQEKRLLLSINTPIVINLIDFELIDLHPAFVRLGDEAVNIVAIGEDVKHDLSDHIDYWSAYIKNGDNEYLLKIQAEGYTIKNARLFQNVVTLKPQTESEWREVLADIVAPEINIDDVFYTRVLGNGISDSSDFVTIKENITFANGNTALCENQVMMYSRETNQGVSEHVMAVAEIIESMDAAAISLYVGIELPADSVTILS